MAQVASVSARYPAPIQIPTVAVCRKEEYSVATERPFDRVVVCVGRMREFAGVARARAAKRVRGLERGHRAGETAFFIRAESRGRHDDDNRTSGRRRGKKNGRARTIGSFRDEFNDRKDRPYVRSPRDGLPEGGGDGDATNGR